MILTKKTDKIVLVPFIRLFILILIITIFIMLMQFLLVWFDELIGKDLGLWVYLKLFFYFGINATPLAFPLATLVASLMVFGSLGEQLELTGLKSAGISFIRILKPLLFFVILLAIFVYFSNGYIVPKVTVKAYTLLYDLRKKKPSIAIKEGVFYNGIPDYSIRVEKKLPDQKTLEDIIIYDHTKNKDNVNMTTAASGQLTSLELAGSQYLVIELFDGHTYLEELPEKVTNKAVVIPNFYRTSFKSQKILINLDAFKLTRTSEQYFTYYHSTKTTREIIKDIAKMRATITTHQQLTLEDFKKHYHFPSLDSTSAVASTQKSATEIKIFTDSSIHLPEQLSSAPDTAASPQQSKVGVHLIPMVQDLAKNPNRYQIIQKALQQAKDLKYKLESQREEIISTGKDLKKLQIEKNKRMAYSVGCIIMLLIGAPLGALIKKGGLGVPLLISTVFILIYYVTDIFGTKWAQAGMLNTMIGVWAANLILLPFGLFFLMQAQKDTRLLEGDVYSMFRKKIAKYLTYKTNRKQLLS